MLYVDTQTLPTAGDVPSGLTQTPTTVFGVEDPTTLHAMENVQDFRDTLKMQMINKLIQSPSDHMFEASTSQYEPTTPQTDMGFGELLHGLLSLVYNLLIT